MGKIQSIKVGDWAVSPAQNLLERDGQSVKLKPRAMDVLVYLADHAGEVVSTDELISTVWQGRVVGDGTVYQSINQLRQALGDGTRKADYIETFAKRGYRLVADVELIPGSVELQKRRRWTGVAATAVVVAAVLFVVTSMLRNDDVPASVAVMPFVNMSSHEENEYFAGGIHEDVLTNLSRIRDLQVKSRTSMLKYASSEMSLSEIGKEMQVDYLVEGSVRRIGNHVRVTIQLIDASNDNHLWANNYERELVNVFATQSALAREISNSLHLEIQPESVEELEGMPTASVKAYDLYIRAASIEKAEGETEESMIRRRAMLEQAVAEDPNFVEAWAVLNRVYDLILRRLVTRGLYLDEGDDKDKVAEELSAKSKRALDTAIALDPDNVETLLSRAVDHVGPKAAEEMQEQKAMIDHIIATYPDNAMAWYHLGWWYKHPGSPQTSEGFAAFEEALKRDPFNARIVRAVLNQYRLAGDQENITRLVERLVQIIPETAADRGLARISLLFRWDNLRTAFLETADETYIEELKKLWEERVATNDFLVPGRQNLFEAMVRMLTNEQGRLLELSSKPISSVVNPYQIQDFHVVNSLALKVHWNRGQLEEAQRIAHRILEMDEIVRNLALDQYADIIAIQAEAYAVLGEVDRALQMIEDSLRNPELRADELNVDRISAMSHIDADRAVEFAFGEKAKHPNWDGFDRFAAFHLMARPLLNHPRVQEHYLNEGKWVDYLSARVPEYAKYKRQAAE